MKPTTRFGRLHCRPLPLMLALMGAVFVQHAIAGHQVDRWSERVWQTAMSGDRDALLKQFEAVPIEAIPDEHAEHFRQSIEARLNNRAAAEAERQDARNRALGQLREHIDANNLSKSLRSALEVQSLSKTLEDAFSTPEVLQVIDWARKEIPDAKRAEDWLRARDLLFALRTLFEDTDRHAEYAKYNEQLEVVVQRINLLAWYAPKQLHELRVRAAEAEGEDQNLEFNPAAFTDWTGRLEGISSGMLLGALQGAARRHIEGLGWRPLLEGGLESLRVLATTALLEETFPGLAQERMVEQWVTAVDGQLKRLAETDGRRLNHIWTADLLDTLQRTNAQTIGLRPEVLYREFGDGAMAKLDQFSEIFWPDKFPRLRQQIEGSFPGVGIMIRHNEKREIVVVNPLEGTPAYFAGIKPEDVIVEVDNEPTVGWSLNDAVLRITGPKGTTVRLGIRRDGVDGLVHFPIVRDDIKLRTVYGWWKTGLSETGEPQWDWFIDPATRIAYIRLTGFREETFADLAQAWQEINAVGRPNGIILDLRFNPGGLLSSAVEVTNMFLSGGLIVSGETKDGTQAFYPMRARADRARAAGVPTVVLINKGSASGSEIVAGALQAHGAALIIGERSYGKGSVQTVETLGQPRQASAALKITTQYYRLPPARPGEQGRLVHRRPGTNVWGVDPDLVVQMSIAQIDAALLLRQSADLIPEDETGQPDPLATDRPDVNDLLTQGLDPQIEMALLILQARALGPLTNDHRRAAR